jgi:hypothetical protein
LRLGSQTTFVDGAQLVMGGGTSLINPSGGHVLIPGTLGMSWNVGGSPQPTTLVNQGNLAKQGSGTATLNGVVLRNDAAVELQAGALALGGGATGVGTFTGAADTFLKFDRLTTLGTASRIETAGAVEFAGQAILEGFFSAGSVVFSGSDTTFNGTIGELGSSVHIDGGMVNFNGVTSVVLPALTLSGAGQLGGTATVVAASLNWLDGAIRGTGTLEIGGTTTITDGGSFGKVLSQRTLKLGTLTVWQDGTLFVENGATIVNPTGGILRFDSDATIGAGFGAAPGLVNQGTMEFAGPARRLILSGSLSNQGTLRHRLGGVGEGQFDQIAFGTLATFGGTLDVRTMNGFIPASGDTFQLFTYPSTSGEFTTIEGNGEVYTPAYGPSTFVLTKP